MHNSRANSKYLIAAASIVALLQMMPQAQAARNDSRAPRYAPAIAPSRMSAGKLMEPKNLPEFAEHSYSPTSGTRIGGEGDPSGPGTALKIGAQSTTLPTETRLKLVLECSVDAKESKPGDIFEAHVKDDLAVGTQLLLPRGSLVRGRVVEVARPRLISRAAKIGLKLEQIVTPTGEVIPLDAALEFRKGTSNEKGQLDPGTSFGTRVSGSVKSVAGINADGSRNGALMAANIATLGAPAAATLIGSSAVALFRSGDNVSLSPGQELEVLLTQDLGLQVN
ncbi:MAG: TrbI/VirB10 family protein [Candidatus Melainabacteria bacterium]|jgi:hypothetical protein|nr:TrbI/VirB10 family protein [Candidatus Melainabacteria bacterium]